MPAVSARLADKAREVACGKLQLLLDRVGRQLSAAIAIILKVMVQFPLRDLPRRRPVLALGGLRAGAE